MIKILLISPPVFDFYYTPARKEPLGLLYIKAALEKIKSVSVDIYDAVESGKTKKIPWPSEFSYLKEIYQEDTSPFSLFSKYNRFGDSFDRIIDVILKGGYEIAAISAMFSGYFPDVESLICRIKEQTRCTVVAGGWAINAEADKLFAESKADFFLLGNGEDVFPAFVDAYINNLPFDRVPGIVFRKNGAVCSTTQPVPSPVPEGFPQRTKNYFFNRHRIAKMVLSRGCFYRCAFCPIHQNQQFSLRSIHSIENEIAYLYKSGVEIIDFEDDNLFCTEEFTAQFLPVLETYHKKGLRYAAMNGITAKNIVPFVDRIIQAGFIELNLSLVTSDAVLSSSVHRPFTLDAVEEVVSRVQGRVKTIVFLILGLPGDTPQNVLADILALAKLPVIIGVSPLYCVPGVPLFEAMGIPQERRLLRGSALYKFGPAFSRENVASLWKYVRMINWRKTLHGPLRSEEHEYCARFRLSLSERRWYRQTKRRTWEPGFSFSLALPHDIPVCTLDGSLVSLNSGAVS